MASAVPQYLDPALANLAAPRPQRNGSDDDHDAGVSDPLGEQLGPSTLRLMGVAHGLTD